MKFILIFTIAMFGFYFNTSLATEVQPNKATNNSVEATVANELPQELLVKFNNELAKLKAKAKSQKTPKQTERMMRFYWQYKNAFDAMPINSQIDLLNIFATGDNQGSKLKGYRLIDRAVEYMVLIDGGFTKENVSKLRKYHNFFVKFNTSADFVLNGIVFQRIKLIKKETADIRKETAETQKRVVESKKRLEELIALRKQMEILAN